MMRTFKLKYCFDNEGIKEIDNPIYEEFRNKLQNSPFMFNSFSD